MKRYLTLYVDQNGKSRATMLTLKTKREDNFPFGVDEFELRLDDYDGEPVTLVEMPDDDSFRPWIVDINDDAEIPLAFVDL